MMNGSEKKNTEERRKFVDAFADTMIRIWLEKMTALGVVDTGNLYSSIASAYSIQDEQVSKATFSFSFSEYGIYVNDGTGRETPKGNPGDIGRAKVRVPREWFRPKYYMSVMNIREFFAKSFSMKFVSIVEEVLKAQNP